MIIVSLRYNQSMNTPRTLHTLSSQVSYGMSFVGTTGKNYTISKVYHIFDFELTDYTLHLTLTYMPYIDWCEFNLDKPFHYHGSTLIPAWISNHMASKVWNEITYLFVNFNDATIEVWEWISNFIPHLTMDVIIILVGIKACLCYYWTALYIHSLINTAAPLVSQSIHYSQECLIKGCDWNIRPDNVQHK